jgi:hypothetical protein
MGTLSTALEASVQYTLVVSATSRCKLVTPVASQIDAVGIHALAAHVSLDAQAWPQAPQFTGSVWVATQAPLHALQPERQVGVHAPAEHNATAFVVLGHTCPQEPQLFGSRLVSTQAPPQLV